ncbi:hypothetical protein QZQ41_17140 [Serratia marcescens]|uniref:hypothetical protein n=1 Tax=Serratia marcescens TaxID=615 RepID=UPI00275A578C|nr:hypothetical protein [Serratia marcescens]MDP8656314.1 hypothetical protein [Serratia marcescens]MDP8661298.1 hypothetical protein [Serratia marcescens]MDP8720538.1 hypothetical protein [Serratia marcescens]MDP8874727.1 hypothetical protein [Serratia marcescens]
MITIKRFTPDYKMHAVRFEAFAREAEHGELVRFDAHQQVVSTLKAERDALAVENAALKSKSAELVHEASEVYSAYNATIKEPDGDFMDMQTLYEMQRIETPATDAALAAIRNEATARVLKHLCDCQLISATVAELKADELREAK